MQTGNPITLYAMWCLQVENIISYNAVSKPMTPAYFIAVDTSQPFINIVVRGTTTWHDALTDLVAHCEPLFQGECSHVAATEGLQQIIPDGCHGCRLCHVHKANDCIDI